MHLLSTIQQTREWVRQKRGEGARVHLVPTMGYFHEGHLSLMRQAKAEGASVIVSLFVNPTQFGPNEDLSVYPRDFERDQGLAESVGVEAIFHPIPEEMYPQGYQTVVSVPQVSTGLCGDYRPGHFEGVATVVLKLFNVVQPDRAFFGMKDYQQLQVIKRMVIDLNLPIEIMPCPIVRESDGLAMSSRNVYLSPDERRQAPVIYQALTQAQASVQSGERSAEAILKQTRSRITNQPLANIQYLELVDADTLKPIEQIQRKALLAAAVYFGKTRLIDNILLEP